MEQSGPVATSQSKGVILLDKLDLQTLSSGSSPSGVSRIEVIDGLRHGLTQLEPRDAQAFATNLSRFLCQEADSRGLVRPGNVKGKPVTSKIPDSVPMSPKATMMLAGIASVAKDTKAGFETWLTFENQVLIVMANARKAAEPKPAPRPSRITILSI